MSFQSYRLILPHSRGIKVGVCLLAFALVAGLCSPVKGDGESERSISPTLLTGFQQIWNLPDAKARQWHRLRMEYTVYYYDPLWQAMWGRCGNTDSFLSIGSKPFPIHPGQRILVEGLIQPAKGLNVEEPQVTVLPDAVTLEPLPTKGDIGNTARFGKRFVSMEGYVDRQTSRDANHEDVELVVEGRKVFMLLLLKNQEPVPQLADALVRVQGVYVDRSEPGSPEPRLEIWVPGTKDIQVLGQLSHDDDFMRPATQIKDLAGVAPGALLRVVGTVKAQQPGKSLTLADGTGTISLPTVQTLPLTENESVEVIGYPVRQGDEWSLSQALYRREPGLITTPNELTNVPDSGRNEIHRVEADLVVYYYDPEWKVFWGRWGDFDTYLTLDDKSVALEPGQEIHLSGLTVPAKGGQIDEAKIKVLPKRQPLLALSTRGRVGQTGTFDRHLVTVEGYVDHQTQNDPRHLELALVTEGRSVTIRVVLPGATTVPNFEGMQLEAKGVYSATSDPLGGLPKIEVWVHGLKDLAPKGAIASDPRFDCPVTNLESLPAVPRDQLVRVEGVVRMQQPGKSVTIRDDTGQINLQTAQTQPLQLGARIEAIGYATSNGTEWELRSALYRPLKQISSEPAQGVPKVLKLAEQVRELSPDEAARGHPVQLSGIVTWENRAADFFFFNDTSGGICVIHPPERNLKVMTGVKVTINGVSAPGKFTPVVLATSLVPTARLDPPEARQVTLEQVMTGIEDSQWISMRGYVRAVEHEGKWARLELTSAAGEFTAQLGWSERLMHLRDSVVQLRGVCSVLTNTKRQLTGVQLWVPSGDYISIEEAAPTEPFAVPTRSLASLRQFSLLPAINRRVRVAGSVVHQIPGQVLNIQDGSESLMVLSRDSTLLAPGDRVEAVGFPGREGNRVVLRDAIFRRLGSGPEPAAEQITGLDPIDVELDGRLVRVQAVLLDPAAPGANGRLVLQAKDVIFEALPGSGKTEATEWVAGSRVNLTGVYQVEFDEYKRPHAVRILMRSPRDLQVLSRPSWVTVGRALAAIGVLVLGWVLGFAWVVALRRRVQQQTGQIREQVESEKAARLEAALARASKLESLGVLAGGIAHDFNNLLTVVMGNLSLAKLDRRLEPETRECLQQSESAAVRARDLTQQLITFAKGGEPVRAITSLPEVVREATEFALHGTKVRCEYEFAPDAWPADVDKGQIGQVVQNIILNATHAMPSGGVIHITLRNEEIAGERPALARGQYLRLAIADNGTGIEAANLPRIFEPYFTTKAKGSGLGLATVYSIVKRHQGHIEVESTPGKGTKFTIWLPAAKGQPVVVPETTAVPAKSARVLFMDDEASIRLLAGALFKRMGFELTAVPDGNAVLREYQAARDSGRPFDLVVLDLTVPGAMGGAEAMEMLRRIDPEVRAIVSSGYSNDPVMANYRAYGFRGRVSKPYEMTEFVRTLNSVLSDQTAPE